VLVSVDVALGTLTCAILGLVSVSDVINSEQKVRLNNATENNQGRKDAEYEAEMKPYRQYFTTGTKGTRNDNARKLKTYCEWIGKTPEQLLEEYTKARESVNTLKDWQRDTKRKIMEFYSLLKTKYKINYARQIPNGILAFYSAHAETIKDATTEFDAAQIPEDEYVFTQDTLRQMFFYGDTEEKTMLALAVSLGYAASDFLAVEAQKMKNLVAEAKDKHLDFIQFIGKSRAKTSVQPRSHLTPEAIDSLNDYLQVLETKQGKLPKYLWSSNGDETHITDEGLNKKLKRLVEKANVKTYGKRVKFHCIRKFVYQRLQAKNKDIAKVVTAKKVSASDITYIPDLDKECERVFRETYKEISLNGDITGTTRQKQTEEIQRLESAISRLATDIQAYKTTSEVLTKEVTDLKNVLRGIIKVGGSDWVEKGKQEAKIENLTIKTKTVEEAEETRDATKILKEIGEQTNNNEH